MFQSLNVTIIWIKVLNNHDQYKNFKIIKKVQSELAIQTNNSIIKELLIMLLNAINENVHKIQDSSEAYALQEKLVNDISTNMLDHESDEDLRQVLTQTVAEISNLHMNMKNSSNQLEFFNQIIITRFDHKILKSANIWDKYRQNENYADLLLNKQKKRKRQFNVSKSEYVSDADLNSSFDDDITIVTILATHLRW